MSSGGGENENEENKCKDKCEINIVNRKFMKTYFKRIKQMKKGEFE
jgi:hypothetical protein